MEITICTSDDTNETGAPYTFEIDFPITPEKITKLCRNARRAHCEEFEGSKYDNVSAEWNEISEGE